MLNNNDSLALNNHLEKMFFNNNEELFTSQPATIKSFNADENTLTAILDKEGIELKDVPITLFGNPASYITTRSMEAGTKGLLIFSKHDLSEWVEDGTDIHAKDTFSLNNAFWLIGATNQKNKVIYNMKALEIKDSKKIHLKAPKIAIDNGSNENFALLKELCNELKSFAKITAGHKGLESTAPYVGKFGGLAGKFGEFIG